MFFEWDETKRQANLAKHLIDFADAVKVFEGPVFEKAQRRHGENRVPAVGLLQDIAIVVIYAVRGKYRRIISARRANRNERKDYASQLQETNARRNQS
jgi:uncharacterized DUF497 family protein